MELLDGSGILNKCNKREYGKYITQIINFLEGKTNEIANEIKVQMNEAATNKNFEMAEKMRDKLLDIDSLLEKHKICARI